MSTSGTTTFAESRDEILRDALTKVGAIGPGDMSTSLPGALAAHAARALNRLVKSIDPDGELLWRVARRTFTTTSGTAAYSPSADVWAIDEPLNYKRSGQNGRSVIRVISRDDYMSISDRTTTGVSSLAFVEQTLSGLTINFWPVPDASSDTIEYAACLIGQEFSTGANTPDFPARWTNCLVLGVAADIAFDYGVEAERISMLRSEFNGEKSRLINAETEQGNMTLVPFGAYTGGWY